MHQVMQQGQFYSNEMDEERPDQLAIIKKHSLMLKKTDIYDKELMAIDHGLKNW
jgi:hypothetical protein